MCWQLARALSSKALSSKALSSKALSSKACGRSSTKAGQSTNEPLRCLAESRSFQSSGGSTCGDGQGNLGSRVAETHSNLPTQHAISAD
jgi:hypothetical protein